MHADPHNQTPRRRGKKGFTLIEAMVAMMILGLTMAGSFAFIVWAVRANDYSVRVTAASHLAHDKIDDLLEGTYSSIGSGSDAVNGYNRIWTVTSGGGQKDINVAVSWNNIGSGTRQVEVKTIVTE